MHYICEVYIYFSNYVYKSIWMIEFELPHVCELVGSLVYFKISISICNSYSRTIYRKRHLSHLRCKRESWRSAILASFFEKNLVLKTSLVIYVGSNRDKNKIHVKKCDSLSWLFWIKSWVWVSWIPKIILSLYSSNCTRERLQLSLINIYALLTHISIF